MKTEKIIWGLILVSVGLVFLFTNLGIIDFSWRVLWRYWPAMLILFGVNMLFPRNNSAAGNSATVLITAVIIAFFVYMGIRSADIYPAYDIDIVPERSTRTENTFSEELSPGTRKAELNIYGGATSYTLQSATSKLFDAHVRQIHGAYSLTKISRDSMEILNFSMNERNRSWRMRGGNNVALRLNAAPLWNINLKLGAGSTDFDLTRFKIANLSFKGGAVSFKVKLGEPDNITNVMVESGVSDIDILVPKSAGCQIKIKSGLSSKSFDGFTNQGEGVYTTSDFTSSSKRIIINISGGLSNVHVKRY
jgi:hypothetical protein